MPKLPVTNQSNKLTQSSSHKIGLPSLMARSKQAAAKQQQAQADVATLPNRLALLLDCSGSMACVSNGKRKIEHLRLAYDRFTQALDFGNTSCCCETFPHNEAAGFPLCTDITRMILTGWALEPIGSTPMHHAMSSVLATQPITRAILISDGCADSINSAEEQALRYSEATVPIDCVHIGGSTAGEALLKQIAEITGGIYIKFTDVDAFAKSFDFLTPAKRSLLLSGQVDAAQLGASEIKFLR